MLEALASHGELVACVSLPPSILCHALPCCVVWGMSGGVSSAVYFCPPKGQGIVVVAVAPEIGVILRSKHIHTTCDIAATAASAQLLQAVGAR